MSPFRGEFPDKECNRCRRWGSRGFVDNAGVWVCRNEDACSRRVERRNRRSR